MKNTVQFLFGAEGIKSAYEMTLNAKKLDIVCLANEYANIIGDYFEKRYSPRLFGSKIKTREILPDIQGNHDDAKKKDAQKNQVKFIDNRPSESDYMLFDDVAILVSYNMKEPYALVIRDTDLVANLQSQFEALWGKL